MNLVTIGNYRAALLALVLLMLVLHGLFYVGYIVSDDSLYLSQAQRYLSGEYSPPTTHWGFRYTVVLPLTLIGMVADYSEQLLSVIPLLYWIGLVGIVAWFINRIVGPEQALYGALMAATLPLFVIQSTILGVDITEALFLFAAFAAFYLADTAEKPVYKGYILAGVLVGLALLTRETAYGFLLVLAIFFLFGGYRRWSFYLAGLAGVLAVVSLEWAYYLAFDQGVFYRLETITQSHGTVGIKSGDFDSGSGNISDNRITGPILAVLVNQEFALLYWVAIIAFVHQQFLGTAESRRLLRYVAITFAVYFFWIGYGGAVRPLPRYFAFTSVLAFLPIALMLGSLSVRWLKVMAVVAIVGANLAALSVENIHPRFSSRAVADFAQSTDILVITDSRSAWQAEAFAKMLGAGSIAVSDQLSAANGSFVYAAVDGVPPPGDLLPHLRHEALVKRSDPPKLLIGHVLDLTGLALAIPERWYSYLAIRNPSVRFYRIDAQADR